MFLKCFYKYDLDTSSTWNWQEQFKTVIENLQKSSAFSKKHRIWVSLLLSCSICTLQCSKIHHLKLNLSLPILQKFWKKNSQVSNQYQVTQKHKILFWNAHALCLVNVISKTCFTKKNLPDETYIVFFFQR
jgi:hypothetical protein